MVTALLFAQFVAQIVVNVLVLRDTLQKSYPHARQSTERVVASALALPFVGLVGIVPAGLALLALGYFGFLVGPIAGIVTSFLVQAAFLARTHRISFGSGAYLVTILFLLSAAIGVSALLHPVVPLLMAIAFASYKRYQRATMSRLAEIADTL